MTRLLVVTLLLAAVALVLKFRSRTSTTTRAIKITSRITINRGSMIAVVEVDGRRLLVGAAANQVNLLAELADASPAEPSTDAPDPLATPGALARLAAMRPRPGRPAETPMGPSTGPSTGTSIGTSTSLVEKARRLTTRTVEPRLRLPHQTGGDS